MGVSHFRIVFVQPSQYDDDGYLYQFRLGLLPSNALSCLRSYTEALAESGAFGKDIEVKVEGYDEWVQPVPLKQIIQDSRRPGTRLVVGLVGVMSSMIPRATDIALRLRAAGIGVLVGGVHVSGILTMFHSPSPDLKRLLDAGVTLVRGEVEHLESLAELLHDALTDSLKPLYSIPDHPDLGDIPVPRPDPAYMRRFMAQMCTLDTSRGCPFDCSFCCTTYLQGKKMRCRSTPAILKTIAANYETGFSSYYFLDDNLARSPIWEELFDGLIALRAQGIPIRFLMMADTQSWKIPGFVEKAAAAGCYQAFFGLETVNPDNLVVVGKKQNRVNEYADMVSFWRYHGILVHMGYIIGLPYDTRASVQRDVEVLRDYVKPDEVTFVMLAPFPGSRDYLNLITSDIPLDPDLNNYDNCHEIFQHRHFPPGEWRAAFEEAWKGFYSKDNIIDIFLRAPAQMYWNTFWLLWWKRYALPAEIHPLKLGLFRRRRRTERRPEFPREGVGEYGRRRFRDLTSLIRALWSLSIEFQEIWLLTRIHGNPHRMTLAALRDRWVNVRRHRVQMNSSGPTEDAWNDILAFFQIADEAFKAIHGSKDAVGRHAKLIEEMILEMARFRKEYQGGALTLSRLDVLESFATQRLIPGFEDIAVPYVARRRRMNALRNDMIQRLKKGRGWRSIWWKFPLVLSYEVIFGLYYGVLTARQRPPEENGQHLQPIEEAVPLSDHTLHH